jgi:hypothetical protein
MIRNLINLPMKITAASLIRGVFARLARITAGCCIKGVIATAKN